VLHSTKTLHILGNLDVINFKSPQNVLELLNASDISIDQSCGGNGICTTCRFFVLKGAEFLSERSELEIERAEERNFLSNERLACQTEISGSAEIEIPT
jgi:ferredoxin, 2Fe-2S